MSMNIVSPEEIADICRRIRESGDQRFIAEGYMFLLAQLPVGFHDVTETTLWRARKADEAHPEGFDYIQDIIYPPAQFAQTGRLNNEGESVLYASVSNHGCLAEIGAIPGDKVQVAAFKLRSEHKLHCGFVGSIVRAHKWNSEYFTRVQKTLEPFTEEQKTSIFLIDSFLAEILADGRARENNYLHTTTLADVLRGGRKQPDAIVYPGVESVGAKNYAIHPDAMLKFNIPDIYFIEITKRYPYGFYEWTVLRQRECCDNGQIIWKAR
ncbi:RES domain-containing protein [Citrobacter sp. wls619]|uniref:RES domain-containing protein n=1 Tax=Citrobacter sp. wls619 TaxID=2576432 RepID=UPI0010C9D1CA|nr:RES domain-containing protein [Citrobacter sp. wls619]TKV06613.1 RES domain-containing protein [Citrobacter sp. wls619]